VLTLTVDDHGSGRRLAVPDVSTEQPESLIAAAMGVPAPRTASDAPTRPAVAVDALLTAEEVGRVVGAPTRAKDAVTVPMMSMQTMEFETTQGRQALLVTLTSGLAATMAMRARRRSTALPGVGDEAYGGDDWALARCGDWVIGLQLRGRARDADPTGLYWLLGTAAGRLAAPTAR
jgi:hypothetical protein